MSNSKKSIPTLDGTLFDDGDSAASRTLQTIEGNRVYVSSQFADFYTRKRSIFTRLFPTGLDKVLQNSEITLAGTDCEFYQRLHALACAMRYESAHEAAEVSIKSVRLETRGAFFTVATKKVETFRETIEQRRVSFATQIKISYDNAEKFKSIPPVYERYKKSIDAQIEDEFGWLDEMLVKFRESVTEGLETYEKRALPSR